MWQRWRWRMAGAWVVVNAIDSHVRVGPVTCPSTVPLWAHLKKYLATETSAETSEGTTIDKRPAVRLFCSMHSNNPGRGGGTQRPRIRP